MGALKPPLPSLPRASHPDLPRASEPEAPRVVGRYALYDRIAAGGMATVHLARLLGPVGFARTVAIKRLHPHFAEDPEFVSMFLDEARVAARIRHPNVVPTLDVVAAEGELFLVMDYVQGESLARLIRVMVGRGERIYPRLAATIMSGVLHGLHAAHEATGERGEPLGIVHRDVSPQNVLVGVDGVARVLDFGVAKAAGRIQTTREGQLKGKLAYMAPEQIAGTVGRTTDVYAASVVLWEALTGKRLFGAESEAEVLKLVLDARVAAPSARAPGIPPALDAITMRGLDPNPAKRFQTAGEMALALEECMPLVPPSQVGKWVESAAAEVLSERSQRVAAIESDSAARVPSVLPPALGKATPSGPKLPAAPATPAREGTAVVTENMILSAQTSGSVSIAGQALLDGARQRRWLVAAAAGGGGLALVVLFAALALPRSGRSVPLRAVRTSTSATPPASAPVIPPPVIPTATPSVEKQAPAAVLEPAPAMAAPASAPARVIARGARAAPPAARASPAPAASSASPSRAPARPADACDPPFYFDKDGTRVFKKECL